MNPLESKSNIFLTGPAGTGKTYLLREYIEAHKETTLVCAPTGTAATALGGTTMHRLFNIPVDVLHANPFTLTPSKLSVFQNADTIIIDEISMCRADVFAYAYQVLNMAEKQFGHKIRVIACGDFAQLSPVVRKEDVSILKRHGFDPSGYAFTTPEWAALKFKPIILDKIYRQENTEFIQALHLARTGDMKCIEYFNQFCTQEETIEGILICGTNAEADRINQVYLESCDGNTGIFFARVEGRWSELPCEKELILKEGIKVMFTVNDVLGVDADHPVGRFQNGSMGTVLHLNTEEAPATVLLDTGEEVPVLPYTWYQYRYSGKGTSITRTKTGQVSQLPLRIAKAITIHKSQGQTYDHVTISPAAFAPGQLYVALSRATGPDAIRLTEPIKPEFIITDPLVTQFYADGCVYVPSKAMTEKRKADITRLKTTAKKKGTKKTRKTKSTTGKTKNTKKKTGKGTGTTKKKAAATSGKVNSTRKTAGRGRKETGKSTQRKSTTVRTKTGSAGKKAHQKTTKKTKRGAKNSRAVEE